MLDSLNDVLWSYILVYGLIVAGLAFTIASRFVQFRYFGAMFGILRQAFTMRRGISARFRR
jgi:alanine or glycine:cation symporter, AGCS family